MAFVLSFRNDTRHNNGTPVFIIDMAPRFVTVIDFSIVGTLGILANIGPLIATLAGYVQRSVVNTIVANLSVVELLLCSSFVFGQSFYVLWRESLPAWGCHMLSFVHFVAAFASFMFPPILAINRHVSLYYTHMYKRIYNRRNAAYMIAGCWLFCIIIPLVFMSAGKTGYDEDNDHCCMVVQGDIAWTVAYWVVIIAPLLLFCDGVMIYCNYKNYLKLKNHQDDAKMISSVVRRNKELLYFLLADMTFPICFHSAYHIFKFALVNRESEFVKRFFITLYLLNSILRGAITVFMLKPYRLGVKRLLCKPRNQINVATTGTGNDPTTLSPHVVSQDQN